MSDHSLLSILGKSVFLNPARPAGQIAAATAIKTVLAHVSATSADGSVRTRTTYSDGSFDAAAVGGDTVELSGQPNGA